jgi:hypothetical protein
MEAETLISMTNVAKNESNLRGFKKLYGFIWDNYATIDAEKLSISRRSEPTIVYKKEFRI